MICHWRALLELLPPWLREPLDAGGQDKQVLDILLGRGQLPLWAPLAAAGLGWLGCTLGALVLRLFLPREERPGLGSVLGFGLFMACWAPLGVLGVLCPPRRWVPVDHTAHLSVRRGRRLHGKRAA